MLPLNRGAAKSGAVKSTKTLEFRIKLNLGNFVLCHCVFYKGALTSHRAEFYSLLVRYVAFRFTFACLRHQKGLFSSIKCNSNLSLVLISITHDLPVTTELSLEPGLVSLLNYSNIFVQYELFPSLKYNLNPPQIPIFENI